jgi:hypothetical protein
MSETREVRKHAGWYKSYMPDNQGKALIECMEQRISADDNLFASIIGEIELCEEPTEQPPELIIQSIKAMIATRRHITVKRGYFEWIA